MFRTRPAALTEKKLASPVQIPYNVPVPHPGPLTAASGMSSGDLLS